MGKIIFLVSTCLFYWLAPVHAQNFVVNKTQEGVEISENGRRILFYQQSPKSKNGEYERAGYVHPLYSLDGDILTEDFPDDHPHQRGIYWAWHQILWHGKKIADSWICENIKWVVKDVQIEKNEHTIVLKANRIWKSTQSVETPRSIITENTSITVHQANPDFRLIDYKIHLKPLLDGLELGGSDDDKGYGGFSLRLKLPEDISFISSGYNPLEPKRAAVSAGPWIDFYGSLGDNFSLESGVAVFNHPANPQPHWKWIIRDHESMQNPVFPGREPVKLTKEGITLKYRLVIHHKSARALNMEALYQVYKNEMGAKFQGDYKEN